MTRKKGWSNTYNSVSAHYNTAAAQAITNNSATIINYDTKVIDTHNAVATGGSWVFTTPRRGVYVITASFIFAATTTWADGETAQIAVLKNTVQLQIMNRVENTSSTSQFKMVLGTISLFLLPGDTISITAFQLSGGTLSFHNDVLYNYVTIVSSNN